MRSYQYAKDDELTREDLIADKDFIIDAGDYLAKRGVLDSEDPNEIYDTFMEQMRYHEVNELDTVSDLMYAQEANDEDREQMARMFETFDRMDLDFTDDLGSKIADYGWGIATAPSTYLGFATGGSGKVASFVGQRSAQAGLRRILGGMLTGAAVEGAIGAGQNVAQQATRMELDPEREFSGTELALVTGLSAVPGAITGGLGQAKRNRLIAKADALKAQADAAMEGAEELANKQVKKAMDQDSSGVKKVLDELAEDGFEEGAVVERGKLRPIDPELVEEGQSILAEQARLIDEGYAVRLDSTLVNRIAVVAKELAEKGGIKVEPGQRITEAVSRAIANKEIPKEILDEVLDTYNISHRELGPIYAATASDAGRVLQSVGQISKSWTEYTNSLKKQKFDSPGAKPAEADSVIEKFIKSPIRIANKIERIRRSILTSQPVTTIRNFFGGGARVTLDMFEQFWASGTRKAANTARRAMGLDPVEDISTIGAGDIARYVWNDEEAKMVADMYMRIDKKGYERMFSNFIDAAEASNNSAVGNGFDRIGSFFNVFNRMSDNFWKKATFAGELSRLTRARYGKSLSDIISEGQFNKIEGDIFDKAVEKSFELVYQQTPKGKGIFSSAARGYLDADKRAGFILGALIPFPRFVINQIKFMYEHAPVLGMLPIDSLTTKGGLKDFNWSKRVGQQINGLGLLGMAYALRDSMGPETEWYNYVKEDGTKLDLRPFLGPLNMHLYIADAIYRSGMFDGDPKPIKAAGGLTGEILQTAIGSSFRAGTGLFVVDRALPELLASFDGEETTIKTDQVIGQILGDYANTYTYQWPIAIARDLYSLTDEDLRLIPETKIGLDYLEITALRARRSLGPLADWLPTVSEEFLKEDIPYIPGDVTLKHMFPFYNVDKPQERYDIFDPKPLRKIDPIRTAVSGLNISPAANAFVKERIRLQLQPYEIYRAHPFPPADRYIRQELSQRLPMQMETVIKSPEYQKLTDAEKKVVFVREAKYLMNEIRNKTRIDEAIAKEMKLGRIPDASERDHLKWRFESLPRMYREAVEARLGPPTEDSNYVDYLKEYDVIKESWFGTVKKAHGGLVQKFAVGGMPTPMDEQMDALSLSEAETAGEEPQSLSGVIGKIAEVGGDVWDNMNYLDRAALVTAPVPVVGDITGLLADAYMYATKPEERTALNYSLTGAGLVGGLPASVTSAIGSSPALLGIFGAANPELRKRYEDILNTPLTKEQEQIISEKPSAIADIMEEKAKEAYQETGVFKQSDIGMDQIPRIEFDDSKAELLNADAVRELENIRSGQLSVGDILKYDDLFEAYPEARNIKIVPYKMKGDESYGGSFAQPTKSNPRGGISINPKMNPDQIRSVLLHELQHYVQFADYLHRGANKNEFLPAGINQVENVLQAETDRFSNMLMTTATPEGFSVAGELKLKLKLSYSKPSEIINDVMRSISPTGVEIENSKSARETVAELERLLGKETTDELIAHANKVKQLNTVKERAFNNYLRASGEVEARFTQSRRDMTFEERMQEIPNVSQFFDSEYPAVFNRHKTTVGATRTDKDYIEDITDNYLAELNKQNESMINLAEELGLDDVARGIKETMRIQNETKQIVTGANKSMSETDKAIKPSNVASMGAKQKFNIEDDYTVYAMSEIDRYMLNKIDDIPWSARSTFIAEREAYKRYLTRADLQEAMNIRNADRAEDDWAFNSKGHLQKIIEEKSGKKLPELLDEIKDELNLPKNQIEWAEGDNDFIAQWGSINDLEDTRSAIEKAQSRWGGKITSDADEAMDMLGDKDAIQAWKDANRLPESQRQKRNPIVQKAAEDLKEGKITGKEYRAIAKAEMPMRMINRDNFPQMPTLEEIVGALDMNKSEKGIVGLNLNIPDGTRIGSRLDIPAYEKYDTWVVSLHDGTVRNGKAVGYGQTAVLDDVEFFTEAGGALNIATKKPKATIARIHGDYVNKDPEEVYELAKQLMEDPEWVQVGMNPFRHSFFYDKATGKPVTRAEQVIQVGPLVLAKGAKSTLSDLKKLKIKSTDGKVRVFNKGGLMSRR